MSDVYRPIACGLYDHLEATAVRGVEVPLVVRDEAGERVVVARIADVFSRDGAEWLRLSTGETIRLDLLVRVGDMAFDGLAC